MRHKLAMLMGALTAACLLALPAVALGHVELISSSPAAGANLDQAPTTVSITFDDELDPDLSSFTVTDVDGATVGSGDVDLTVADRNVMTGSLHVTDPGVFSVRYTVAGVDGHELAGSFSFGYQAQEGIAGSGGHGPDTAMEQPPSPLPLVAGMSLILTAAGLLLRHRGNA
jgi:hypothetical protein